MVLQEDMSDDQLYNDSFGMLDADTLMAMAIAAPYEASSPYHNRDHTLRVDRIKIAFKDLVIQREAARKKARELYVPNTIGVDNIKADGP